MRQRTTTLEDVHRTADELRSIADRIADRLPAARARLADQLRDAASAVMAHIAARRYRTARHATTEAAAILDVCRIVAPTDEPALDAARNLLVRTFADLTGFLDEAAPAPPVAGSWSTALGIPSAS